MCVCDFLTLITLRSVVEYGLRFLVAAAAAVRICAGVTSSAPCSDVIDDAVDDYEIDSGSDLRPGPAAGAVADTGGPSGGGAAGAGGAGLVVGNPAVAGGSRKRRRRLVDSLPARDMQTRRAKAHRFYRFERRTHRKVLQSASAHDPAAADCQVSPCQVHTLTYYYYNHLTASFPGQPG